VKQMSQTSLTLMKEQMHFKFNRIKRKREHFVRKLINVV